MVTGNLTPPCSHRFLPMLYCQHKQLWGSFGWGSLCTVFLYKLSVSDSRFSAEAERNAINEAAWDLFWFLFSSSQCKFKNGLGVKKMMVTYFKSSPKGQLPHCKCIAFSMNYFFFKILALKPVIIISQVTMSQEDRTVWPEHNATVTDLYLVWEIDTQKGLSSALFTILLFFLSVASWGSFFLLIYISLYLLCWKTTSCWYSANGGFCFSCSAAECERVRLRKGNSSNLQATPTLIVRTS